MSASRFEAHLRQANSNLTFLASINKMEPDRYDWQVTVAFYAALHVVNAWLCDHGIHYRSHHEVKAAINPYNGRITKVPHAVYQDYQTLFRLSRRARYLIDEQISDETQVAHTSDKHFGKAIRRLDQLLSHFGSRSRSSRRLPFY